METQLSLGTSWVSPHSDTSTHDAEQGIPKMKAMLCGMTRMLASSIGALGFQMRRSGPEGRDRVSQYSKALRLKAEATCEGTGSDLQGQQDQYFHLSVNRAQLSGTSKDSAQDHTQLGFEPQASKVPTL